MGGSFSMAKTWDISYKLKLKNLYGIGVLGCFGNIGCYEWSESKRVGSKGWIHMTRSKQWQRGYTLRGRGISWLVKRLSVSGCGELRYMETVGSCDLTRFYTTQKCNLVPTLRDTTYRSHSGIKQSSSAWPIWAASNPRKMQILFTSRQKPPITQGTSLFGGSIWILKLLYPKISSFSSWPYSYKPANGQYSNLVQFASHPQDIN